MKYLHGFSFNRVYKGICPYTNSYAKNINFVKL